ncbi:MAG: hypothetical protein M3P18_24755 [Actinomycetota bacterium]|nr:hypothetical protein [Actinomycetota bacterium]
MNRAWIPAGALAGVSVAGLIALGPLTDSLGTPVTFNPVLAVTTPTAGNTRVAHVSVDQGASGTTATAALKVVRGGEATIAAVTPSGDAGQVGFHRTSSSSQTRGATTTVKSTTKATPKTVTRANSFIGAESGPNGDNGLTGGGSGSSSTNVGTQSGTPGSETP